jgi:cathepsin L
MLLCICALAGVTTGVLLNDPDFHSLWKRFKERYAKRYSDDEDTRRRHIWEDHIRLIQEHNLEADLGEQSYSLGLNRFADWSKEEFRQFLMGFRPDLVHDDDLPAEDAPVVLMSASTTTSLPASVDWVKNGWVTDVKDQGKCGCCYTFAATGALEAQLFNTTKKLVTLSEQNLLDCSKTNGNQGCNGGVTDYAFRYVVQNGIESEETYAFTGKEEQCKFSSSRSVTKCRGYVDIPRGNEQALQAAIANVGPVAVALDASLTEFQLYRRGVFKSSKCSSTAINHAVLAVGYGESKGEEYWLIKNSWGKRWGDDGYVKIARNQNNMCGIAQQASYPTM